MSLPPKLLERLKKRGIIKDSSDQPEPKRPCAEPAKHQVVIGCPNKYNEFHDCSSYCESTYANGVETPPTKIKRIYEILVESYPLTDEWQCVWEPGIGRFYFYNVNSNDASWLPPGHPKFKATKGIRVLKGEMESSTTEQVTADRSDSREVDEPSGAEQQSEENKQTAEELDQFESELNSELSALAKGEPADERHSDEQSNEDSDESNDSEDQAGSYGSDDGSEESDANN